MTNKKCGTGTILTEITKLTFPNVDAAKPQPKIPKLIISKDDMAILRQAGSPGTEAAMTAKEPFFVSSMR